MNLYLILELTSLKLEVFNSTNPLLTNTMSKLKGIGSISGHFL